MNFITIMLCCYFLIIQQANIPEVPSLLYAPFSNAERCLAKRDVLIERLHRIPNYKKFKIAIYCKYIEWEPHMAYPEIEV